MTERCDIIVRPRMLPDCIQYLHVKPTWLRLYICYKHIAKQQKGGQSNQLQIIMHQLYWLGIKQIVYLACSKCTALVKLVLHASILCSLRLVAFLASHWYHTFHSFSNLHFLGLTYFHSKNVFLNGYIIGSRNFLFCEKYYIMKNFNSRNFSKFPKLGMFVMFPLKN